MEQTLNEHPQKSAFTHMVPSEHDSGLEELLDSGAMTLGSFHDLDFDSIPPFADLDFTNNADFRQSRNTDDLSLNAVAQNSDGASDMGNTQSVESIASIGDATDRQPSHLPTTVDIVAPTLVSQISQYPSVDNSGTQHQGWAYTFAEDGLSQGEWDASIDPQSFSYPKVGTTGHFWSNYINTDVNMPVASLENLNSEEALTNDFPFPQHAATSLSLDPPTLHLPNAMCHETMVYHSSGVPDTNYSQVPESHPPVPLQLDAEPQVTMLQEPTANKPKGTQNPANEVVFEKGLTVLQYSPISNKFEEPDEDPRLKSSEKRKHITFLDETAKFQEGQSVSSNRATKRINLEKRKKTALTRQNGACERCVRGKKECDLVLKPTPYEKCTGCYSRTYRGVLRMPCSQSKLSDAAFFRILPKGPFETRRKAVFDLADASANNAIKRTLTITQHIGRQDLVVYAAEFISLPGDKLSYNWTDAAGEKHSMPMPHFCLTDLSNIKWNLLQYIVNARVYYIKLVQEMDGLAWMTFSAAMEFVKDKVGSMVDLALNLWTTARVIEIPWQFCGSDTLGTKPPSDPANPWFGKLRLPPMMDTQLDQIVIQEILQPLRAKILQLLDQRFRNHQPDNWFETYLTVFILLNHTSMSSKHGRRFSKTYGTGGRYPNMPQFEGYFHTAKMLLSRFHFVCNGSAPLRLEWKNSKATKLANLKPHEIQFMNETQRAIQKRETQLAELKQKHKYESELYWCHQMFFDDWDSGVPHIEEEQT